METHSIQPLQTHSSSLLNSISDSTEFVSGSGSSEVAEKTLSSSEEDCGVNSSPLSQETVPDLVDRSSDYDGDENEEGDDYYLTDSSHRQTSYYYSCSSHFAEPWTSSDYLRSAWTPWSYSWSQWGAGKMEDSRASEDDSVLTDWMSPTELDIKPSFSAMAIEPKPSVVGAGLANMGNTCFLNVILQCFTHTVPLLQGLLSRTHKVYCERFIEGFCVFCNLFGHIEMALTNPGEIVSPVKFVNNLNYFSSSFRRFQQEDAHEFLQCFLDKLESSDVDFKPSESESIVKRVFGGRLVSTLRCCNCGHRSDKYEPLIDISLEIDEVSSLSTALESFTKVEQIEFECEHCKEQVTAEKQLMLDQAPSVATFHLKRFKNDGSFVEKIDNHVAFPLELDLLPYAAGDQSEKVEMRYDLSAVVVHTGFSSTSGHYFCFVRAAPDEWYRFDDSKVYVAEQDQVLDQEAYILFYVKRGTPCFSSFVETLKQQMDLSVLNTSPKSVLDTMDVCTSPNLQRNCHFDVKKAISPDVEEIPGTRDSSAVDDSDKTDNSISGLPSVSSNSSDLASHNIKESASVSCANNSSEVPPCKADTSSSSVADDPPDIPCEAQPTSSPPVLKESDSGQERLELGSTATLPSVLPRPFSPEIYRKDPSENSLPLSRGHDRLTDRVSCKRQLNRELEDQGRKQASTFVKKNMPGVRGKQFIEAIYRSSKEVSASKKRSRGVLPSADSDDRTSASRRRGSVPVRVSRLR